MTTDRTLPAEMLGPAERLINHMVSHVGHLNHGRPGLLQQQGTSLVWSYAQLKQEGTDRVLYEVPPRPAGTRAKAVKIRRGVVGPDGEVRNGAVKVGRYAPPGLVPEVAVSTYRVIADVFRMDNELVARWASHQAKEASKDAKVILAAFLLVQNRFGERIKDGDGFLLDDDYRSVGEALLFDLDPKQMLRVFEVLKQPGVAQINRELGFTASARNEALGRFPEAVRKYLAHLEANPRALAGMTKAGWRQQLMKLARIVGFKPETDVFFSQLRWKQKQSEDGHRSKLIGSVVKAAETWAGLTEQQICERIEKTHPAWRQIVSMVPADVGITPAIAVCAVSSGCLSGKGLIIATPTLEELGVLNHPAVKSRWEAAAKAADDTRAANVAKLVRTKEAKEALAATADQGLANAVAPVMRDMDVWVIIDASGSMQQSIERAKALVTRIAPAFPMAQLKVATFNTVGRELELKSASAAAVAQAFRGVSAGGGTKHSTALRTLAKHAKPDHDLLIIWVGDEEESGSFAADMRQLHLSPVAFGLLRIASETTRTTNKIVRESANQLGIPCFEIVETMFRDPDGIPKVLRNMISATPIQSVTSKRVSLVEKIMQTPLLQKPNWA